MTRRLADSFSRLAKDKGYVARSAFKLLEIQHRFKVIKPGDAVLDLGCSPGAWLQVSCQALKEPAMGGSVLGVDIQFAGMPGCPVPKAFCDSRIRTLQADARSLAAGELLAHASPGHQVLRGFNAVLSDMCHSTLGVAAADVSRSLELAQTAAAIALGDLDPQEPLQPGETGVLLPGGHLVVKLLQGAGSQDLHGELKRYFEKVHWVQPKATRRESREMYLVGLRRKFQA